MTTSERVSAEQRQRMIADTAYFRAERRGFNGGDPVVDWLEAEAEVDARLGATGGKTLLEELDERLALANGRLRTLKGKLSTVKADVREELTQDFEKLGKLRDKLEKKLDEVRAQGEQASEKAKVQADKIWREISDVVERASSRKAKQPR